MKRVAKQEAEWEERAKAQEREQDLIKDMEHKAKVNEKAKRMQVDSYYDNQGKIQIVMYESGLG